MDEQKKIEQLSAELAGKDATTQLLWQQLALKQQLSEIDAVANTHAYEIIDVKRHILDELYKFPAVELLGVLLELQKEHKKENENGK